MEWSYNNEYIQFIYTLLINHPLEYFHFKISSPISNESKNMPVLGLSSTVPGSPLPDFGRNGAVHIKRSPRYFTAIYITAHGFKGTSPPDKRQVSITLVSWGV